MDEFPQSTKSSDRDRLSRMAPLLTSLTAYLFLTVLMNVVFAVYDDRFAAYSIADFSILDFPIRTAGYWALLFLPFLLVPPVAFFVRWIFADRVAALFSSIPEVRPLDYLVMICVCYAIVVSAMYRSDALGLLLYGSDSVSAVEARFELLGRLRFFERGILQSVLVFLTLYSLVRAIRCQSPLWFSFFCGNLVAMAALLFLLNMKWPIVVLFGGVLGATALFAKHRFTYLTIGIVCLVCVYMLVAAVVLRLPQTHTIRAPTPTLDTVESGAGRAEDSVVFSLKGTVMAAISSSVPLAITGLIRMATPYPFYYRTFTDEGTVCGTLLDRVERRVSPCQPSLLIYQRMFGNDGFESRGTAPAAFHITGYALGGWPGAIVESVLAAIVIGIFMAVPAYQSSVSGTVVVMGILAGYFFSQLPFEGPIVYDHGFLWWSLVILAYLLIRRWALGARVRKERA